MISPEFRTGGTAIETVGTGNPDPATLIGAGQRLWEAQDGDAATAVATHLLQLVAPAATAKTCDAAAAAETVSRHPDSAFAVPIPGSRAWVAMAPDDSKQRALVRQIADVVDLRFRALREAESARESIARLQRSEQLQQVLATIARAADESPDSKSLLDAVHGGIGEVLYARNMVVATYDPAAQSVDYIYESGAVEHHALERGDSASAANPVHGPLWYVLHDGHALVGSPEDVRGQLAGRQPCAGSPPYTSVLAVPMLDGAEVRGGILLWSDDPMRRYIEADRALLAYIAQHVHAALARHAERLAADARAANRSAALARAGAERQRETEVHRHAQQLLLTLLEVAELASKVDEPGQFFPAVHRAVDRLLHAPNFLIAILARDGQRIEFQYAADEQTRTFPTRPPGRGLVEYVLRRNAPALVDAAERGRLLALGEVVQHGPPSRCWLGVPLTGSRRTIGVMAIQSYTDEAAYTRRDRDALTLIGFHVTEAYERMRAHAALRESCARLEQRVRERTSALITTNQRLQAQMAERARVEVRLQHENTHDALTELPNRTLLVQKLADTLDRCRAGTLRGFVALCLDLDRFKVINDSVGHVAGDELLVEVARRLRASVSAEHLVARLGGDEFVVLLEDVTDMADAERIGQRIITALDAPLRVQGRELYTSASIGIAAYRSEYTTPDDVLRDADAAMYQAKADGRHRSAAFDDRFRRQALDTLEMEGELRHAIERHEFVPYYQPIVSLDTGRIAGYEALARWQHPQRGLLTPAQFLPVAEETGLVDAIDWQVYGQACADATSLAAPEPTFVAINLSARHFREPGLEHRLMDLLHSHKLAPSSLHVEVTEELLLDETSPAKQTLTALRKAGVGLDLDDFGTGYSSLSYVQRYPLQGLKIDRSFVTNLTADLGVNRDALIRTILAMAKVLALQTTAEGIETPLQRDVLRRLGCRYGQGFLYGRPQPIEAWRGSPGAASTAAPASAMN